VDADRGNLPRTGEKGVDPGSDQRGDG
jgi:hypothetical protein